MFNAVTLTGLILAAKPSGATYFIFSTLEDISAAYR